MNTTRIATRILFAALFVSSAFALNGCGRPFGGCNGGGGLSGGGGLLGQRTSRTGGGRSGAWNSPVLGGGGGPAGNTPPSLTRPSMPSAPVSFDADTTAVLQRYNAQIGGPWASQEYVAFVIKCLQLYPALRQHPLQIEVGPDDSKPGLSGLWTMDGNSAHVYLYDPSVESTPAHEIAHDQTLAVQQQEGSTLMQFYGNVDDSAYARGYSQSDQNEFAADALSYWARRVSGLDPNSQYQPPAAVIRAIQPLLIDKLRSN